ncbi:MAG: intradiol ring-cleavage dioxygenase [Litorivicinaceae bacterium]|nr:intradiol ring-cleavage dioxygenase [Gammaproteobacteria bacterium]RPG19918.1 MAG: intradiol ring-cleavage dioxygenase [Oceanospirillales bacterium TMED33]RZO74811.1 MAG: intradiol ring-cleavage dioxygenase [Litorivicinaceae bacterium]
MRLSRRSFLSHLSGLAMYSAAGVAGARVTPRQSLGPFYPQRVPVDSDADLTFVDGKAGQAKGQVTMLFGRVIDRLGVPVEDARVEIWQCDAFGSYHHPRDGGGVDPYFQGYGQTTTDRDGAYQFRTIKPVAYPGRAPHIHMKIGHGSIELVTQIYVRGEAANQRDFLLNAIKGKEARQSLVVTFEPDPNLAGPGLVARFDPVLG